MSGQILTQVNKAKYLGVYTDENLTWKDHVSYISCILSIMYLIYHVSYISLKITRGLEVMNRVRKIVSRHLLITLYNTDLVLSFLLYDCLEVCKLLDFT